MIVLLNIETATKNCSVSLSVDGTLAGVKEIAEENFSHAEKLHVFIEELLKENNLKMQQLSAIAVSQGPGSYTGLRIGVSSVKGLCYGLNIPMIALDTLRILAKQLEVSSGWIIPMIDARRMEVFCATFSCEGELVKPIEAKVVDEASFSELKGDVPVYFIGDGAMKCETVLTAPNFNFCEAIVYPSAKEMVTMSYEKYLAKDFVDVAYFEPYYLKDFVMPVKQKK
ncbi:tRNA (adenosine(37)-N6)-threonylcarbamoyltransferase complex dimerization subunit type 1 TsaB [Myroides fluvii]|uniref:tRNA (adenosine(37)-N6)-threonylcarbamoyltransferase complex dimerization subunit type 1 TsaB n=1 Tax=Myroides fluvii TaxID=2572594 RepID=UPI00131DD512|nr:tRNA (adenosine(37)-N6)-threonylcarbamoyltransferase complex dimerization subunit type 1 TsaB [Myroides fluvii]